MRPSIPILVLSLVELSSAAADRRGGGNGSRGPLGQTSGGIGAATGAGRSQASSGSTTTTDDRDRAYRDCYDNRGRTVFCPEGVEGSVVLVERPDGTPPPAYTGDRARFDAYAGIQKVADSDGSISLEASVTDGYRFRLSGAFHHYFETQADMGRITMSMPSLLAGVRIDDLGATAVHVDAGVVHAGTEGDPMGSSSITGPIVGVAVEHQLSRRTSLLGEARTMWFEDDVRANSGRLGVRVGHLQASVRVLDFNVGPPLYGPEVGVRF